MFLSNVTNQISVTVDVDPLKDNYIIKLQPSTTATYNLPKITCDGTNFLFTRIDNQDTIISFNAFSGDIITLNSGLTVTSYNISNFSTLNIFSLDETWHICKTNTILNKNNYFCTSFVGNNGIEFIVFNSNSLYQIVCVFPYSGAQKGVVISKIIITTNRNTSIPSGNWANKIRLYDLINSQLLVERSSTTTPILTMITTSNSSYWIINILQSEITNFPSSSTLISLDIIFNTNGTGIYSVLVF